MQYTKTNSNVLNFSKTKQKMAIVIEKYVAADLVIFPNKFYLIISDELNTNKPVSPSPHVVPDKTLKPSIQRQ